MHEDKGRAEAQRWRIKNLLEGKQALTPPAHLENVTIETGSLVDFSGMLCTELGPPGYLLMAQGLGCAFKEQVWQAGCSWASGQELGTQIPGPCPEPAARNSWDVGAGWEGQEGGGRRPQGRWQGSG